jgi:hypothetical protein
MAKPPKNTGPQLARTSHYSCTKKQSSSVKQAFPQRCPQLARKMPAPSKPYKYDFPSIYIPPTASHSTFVKKHSSSANEAASNTTKHGTV